ncbi:MAG: VOC family protein [Myxococcota bacterium]
MSYKPEGYPTAMACLSVTDVQKSMDFYKRAFGFELVGEPTVENGQVMYAELRFSDMRIMLSPEGAYGMTNKAPIHSVTPPSMSLYIYCRDVDGQHRRAIEAGAKELQQPQEMFWKDRMCRVSDPDGYVWAFATHVGVPPLPLTEI